MDLKAYYRKVRGVEASIEEDFPVIRSLATEEGGIAGRLTEVPRAIAAQMINDGKAALTTEEEAREFRKGVEEARKREQQRARAAEIQFTILSEADLRTLQGVSKKGVKE